MAITYAGLAGDIMVGRGGLCWHEGLCWIWIEPLSPEIAGHGMAIVRAARRMLQIAQRYGESVVFAVRDETEAGSDKLLKLIGFTLADAHGATREDGTKTELWTWRTSQQLRP